MKLSLNLRIIAGCVLFGAFAAAALTAYAFSIEAEARRILLDFYGLQVGTSNDKDVQRVVDDHRSHLVPEKCDADRCFYFFEVTNRWLARIKAEPDARLQAWIEVKAGKVQTLLVEIQRDTRVFPTYPSAGVLDEFVIMPDYFRSGNSHYSFPTPVGKPYLRVAIDKGATAEQRRRAYAFSLTCLIKPGGGCDLPCDYLPLAWKDWESELKSSGWGFGQYYPDRSRCK